MNTPSTNCCLVNVFFRAIGMLVLGVLLTTFAATNTTSILDSGGKRVSSADYTIEGSVGIVGGLSSATSPQVTARHGYAGQLYNLQTLVVGA